MPLGSIAAAVVGALIAYPASKLVFHFLSLATLAFGEIVYQLFPHSPGNITNNFVGYYTESVSLFGFQINTNQRFFYFALACTLIFLIAKQRLIDSKVDGPLPPSGRAARQPTAWELTCGNTKLWPLPPARSTQPLRGQCTPIW